MIRRWSYINQLNLSTSHQTFKIHAYSTDSIVNSIMYLRKDYPQSTQAFRKRWARRKHTNNYLFLSNILISWAKEYRFYKNYNRSVHNQFFFLTTYLAFNLSFLERPSSELTKTVNPVLGSSWPLKTSNYFKHRFSTLRFFNVNSYKNISWLYVSSLKPLSSGTEISKNISFLPFMKTHLSFNTPLVTKEVIHSEQLSVLHLIERIMLVNLTSYYGTLTKLLLTRIH